MTETQIEKETPAEEKKPQGRFFTRLLAGPKKFCRTSIEFSKELWNDHQFWINAYAIRGGAAAIVAGAAVTVTFAYTFPFLVTAGIILLCGATAAMGVVGILAGASKAWDKLKEAWCKACGKEPPPPHEEKKKTLLDRLKEKPFMQKIIIHPWSEKFRSTRTWSTMQKIAKKQDALLGGLAVGGSVAYTAVGVWLLAVQLIALPVIAIPTLLTVAILGSASYIASGSVGIWVSISGMIKHQKEKSALHKKEACKQGIQAPAPEETLRAAAPTVPPKGDLKNEFDTSATQQPVNDDNNNTPVEKTPKIKSSGPPP